MKSTTKYLIAVVAVVLAIAAVAALGMLKSAPENSDGGAQNAQSSQQQAGDNANKDSENKNSENKDGENAPTQAQTPSNTKEPDVMPTFKYFVSKNDALYESAEKVYFELEAEYGSKVNFELLDVDEQPDLKDRFMVNKEDSPIPMKTPTLIMLDVHNNISTIGLSECADKTTLKNAIEKALNS